MSRANPPIVTGVSPKDGPPGTRVTVRGENFGLSATDLVKLTICGCDCTLSAEWKGSNKIIARSGPGKGPGDIIVTTRQGGEGTCNVKFRGYHETIGPTKESAVWVEDTPVHLLSGVWRARSPSSYQQEDPLGLSIEATDKTIPEDDLNDLFPGKCGDLSAENFSPGWFLLEHHHATNFEDLKAGFSYLTRKVENQKECQLSFLKSNVGSVLDQVDTLAKLKDKLEFDVKSNKDFTTDLKNRIEETKDEAHKLFEDVLARRERADATRNALSVLQRFKFLFCLPSSIERNTQRGDFDLIINDYFRVKHLFQNSDVALFQKYLVEVEERIGKVRETLLKKLEDVPPSVDDYMKIIKSLINLETKLDVAWIGTDCFANQLNQSMHDMKDKFIVMESSESAKKGKVGYKHLEGKPPRVMFVEELVDLLELKLPDLWKLGQTYFGGDLQVDVDLSNQPKFKAMVLHTIQTFSNLLRAAILPQSLGRNPQIRQTYGTWSNTGMEASMPWLPHCLRYFRSCFIRIDLPSDALDIFSKLIYDLRLFLLLLKFKQAAEDVTRLTKNENWSIDVKDKYGGVTDLPNEFEELCKEVMRTSHESVLIAELRETPLLESASTRKEVSTAIVTLFTNFAGVLELLAFLTDEEQSEKMAVISQLVATSDVPKSYSSTFSWEQRLLVVLCNCKYLIGCLLPRLWEQFKVYGYPVTPDLQKTTKEPFVSLRQKILDQYHEQKCDPLVGTIEPSMYLLKFDWDTILTPTDVRPYAQEIIMNLIGVRSELYRVPRHIVHGIMCKIVETVSEELARLITCVKGFSTSGSIQAYVDIVAVQVAVKAYLTNKSIAFFKEILASIPRLGIESEAVTKDILNNFNTRFAIQLLCLNEPPQK